MGYPIYPVFGIISTPDLSWGDYGDHSKAADGGYQDDPNSSWGCIAYCRNHLFKATGACLVQKPCGHLPIQSSTLPLLQSVVKLHVCMLETLKPLLNGSDMLQLLPGIAATLRFLIQRSRLLTPSQSRITKVSKTTGYHP